MATRYKIRNRLLEVLGEYSAKEITKRIQAGRFTGEEEVSTEPFHEWQKLSAHPIFYDAFIKRIYADEYHPPAGATQLSAPSASQDAVAEGGKTRRDFSESEAKPDDRSGKTRLENPVEPGHTIHQSEIEELFSAEAEAPPPDATQVGTVPAPSAGKTALIPVPTPGAVGEAVEPQVLAEFAPPVAEAKPTRKLKPLHAAAIAIVVVGLGWVFFQPEAEKAPEMISDAPPPQALGSSASAEEKAVTLGDEAAQLLSQDTLLFTKGAYELLREAIDLDPRNPALLIRLATASAGLAFDAEQAKRRRPEIEQVIARARKTDPQASELFRAEAIVAVAEGNLEAAKKFALKAAETDPAAADNLLLIGELHYTAGNLSEAKSILIDAVKADVQNVRAHYYLAKISLEGGDSPTAQREGVEALKRNPLHPKTYIVLADAAVGENRLKDARGLFETAGRLARFSTPDVAGYAFQRLGELQELAGNSVEASQAFQLAFYYLKGGNELLKKRVKGLDTKPETLKKLAAAAEYQTTYFQEQGTGLLTQGKTEEALRFFQAAQLLAPNDGLALIQLGEVMEKTATSYEDFRRVMSCYQRAIQKDPTEAMGYIKLGMLETEQYNFDRGHQLLTQALALAPESEKPYVALGKHYYKREDFNEALNQFLKAAKINPSDSEIMYYAGKLRLVYKKDGARDAARFFSQAYTLDSRNYDALSEWLKLKVTGYEKNFAVKFVNNLVSAEPNNPMLYWVLGEVYAENKEYRRAITYYHKSLDYDNRQSKVRMALARSLEAVGELDKAVAEFRLASLLDRRNSEGFYRAADLLFQMKAYQQSEEVLRFLMGITPNYPGVHRYLAKIQQLREQKDQAVESMRREVANNPGNYKFILELSEMLVDYNRQEEAIEELKKITALPMGENTPEFKSEKIRAYLLLSRAFRSKSQAESAESAIKLAIALDSNDPELQRELGYVYYALQRDAEGVKAFQTYLDRNPAARDAGTIKALIKKMEIEE
ncbi:tetratricopeptide repeat protein [bacterium]|nr:tetratricopeptide repeat protein [bacterium]